MAGIPLSSIASIRKALAADLAGALALLQRVGLPWDGVVEGWSHFLVAKVEERLVGVAGLELYPPVALLRSVAVAPECQRHGIGSCLVRAQLERAKARGVAKLYLLTTDAQDFFARFGFVALAWEEVDPEAKNSVEFNGACPVTAQAMGLSLRQSVPLEVGAGQ